MAAAYLMSIYRRLELETTSRVAQQRALHDDLTGLPNRTLIAEHIEHAVLRVRRTGRIFTVLYMDLDGFKGVNDTFGHGVGDEVLVAVTARLSGLLRPPDTLARLHGDEFVLLCEDLTDPEQAVQICHRLQDALDSPLTIGGIQIRLRASIGVVVAGPDDKATGLLRDADSAMYEAKKAGGAQFSVHRSDRSTC